MFFFTHLHYAKLLYPELATLFHLDKKAFSYGNIKPDLPSKNRRAHLMEEYLEEVNQLMLKLEEHNGSTKEYSIILGEICHYLCDFFCYYHTSSFLHDKSLKHVGYELYSYFMLLISPLPKLAQQINQADSIPIQLEGYQINSFLHKMIQTYDSKQHSPYRDSVFALHAAYHVCHGLSQITYQKAYEADSILESLA